MDGSSNEDDEGERVARELGQRLIEVRRAQRLTQEKLATLTAIDARELRRIEGGGNTTVYTLARIAKALQVPVADLFRSPKVRWKRQPGRPKEDEGDDAEGRTNKP